MNYSETLSEEERKALHLELNQLGHRKAQILSKLKHNTKLDQEASLIILKAQLEGKCWRFVDKSVFKGSEDVYITKIERNPSKPDVFCMYYDSISYLASVIKTLDIPTHNIDAFLSKFIPISKEEAEKVMEASIKEFKEKNWITEMNKLLIRIEVLTSFKNDTR